MIFEVKNMDICCICRKKKETPYQYRTGDSLCEDCASGLMQCADCSWFFEPEFMNGSFCEPCSRKMEND